MTVIDIDKDNWDDFTDKEGLVVVEFWHEQCPWCKKLNPEFKAASEELQEKNGKEITYTRFNILESEENKKIAMSLGIMSTPTILFFCHGRPVGMMMGYKPKEAIMQEISRVLKQSEECINKSSPSMSFYA